MVIKLSRFGKFLSCSGYPECKSARPLHQDPEKEKELEVLKEEFKDEKCEKCTSEMVVKTGRYGNFLACSNYPKCKNTKPILKTTGVKCPDCKKGELVEKRTKKGRIFWGCERYPKCEHASWKDPRKKEE
jgi:DNA topoisomerase-1